MILDDPRFAAIVCEHLRFPPAECRLETDMVLGDLGLDSMGMVALLLDLEDEYGVQLPDVDLSSDTFRTAGTLWSTCQAAYNGVATPEPA